MPLPSGFAVIGTICFLKPLQQFLCGGNQLTGYFIKMNISSPEFSNLLPGLPVSQQ